MNIVDSKLVVKVSDFGMSRYVDDYYKAENSKEIPVKVHIRAAYTNQLVECSRSIEIS